MSGEPWSRFLAEGARAETCGYFERPGMEGGAGRAWWFSGDARNHQVTRTAGSRTTASELERFLARHPRGAALGYLGFDAVGLFEPALCQFPAGSPFPLGEFALVPEISTGPVPPRPRVSLRIDPPARPQEDSLPPSRFGAGVRRLVEAIRAGEAFQVVLAHRRTWRRPEDLLQRAGRLRRSERFSSFFYLRFGERELVGTSPESVSEVTGRTAFVDPIAGTIPRGPRGRRLPLRSDPKELCEHRMLVDLARNDLGRVARAGTVRLPWTERVVRYARLDHLVSRVSARLRTEVRAWDVLEATFPAGTVTGAPKIRATELLREEEATWRGPYGGAATLLLPGGGATFALAIRTAFAADGRLHTAAGAGIVHRSQPAREYRETLAKLSTIESALLGTAG